MLIQVSETEDADMEEDTGDKDADTEEDTPDVLEGDVDRDTLIQTLLLVACLPDPGREKSPFPYIRGGNACSSFAGSREG